MMDTVTYRHNIMKIETLNTFFSIRGGFNHCVRDVYFVRAVGECSDYAEKIYDIEKRMRCETARARSLYYRVGTLTNIPSGEQISYYSAMYDKWKNDGSISFGKEDNNRSLLNVVSNALLEIETIYRKIRKGVSETILRNFSIKVLYWLDRYIFACLYQWNEKSCIKIVLENVLKDQEYLFGYFLTLLGCDVLILANKSDIVVSEELKGYSQVILLGEFGDTNLKPYSEAASEEEKTVNEETKYELHEKVKVIIPERVRKNQSKEHLPETKNVVVQSETKISAALSSRTPNRKDASTEMNEKSFEELAQMASSIVMITVYNSDRESIGTGSGIMIGKNGFILTNQHVIAGGRFFSVRMEEDEKIYSTDEVIKYNTSLDLAVIRIRKILKPLSVYRGKKKLVRGQKVVAIGSPLGLFNSVSDGIISGFRTIQDNDMIQFTAPISPGSSGGAVLNMYGEVIGISTAGFDSGQNINLAVSYEDILVFANGFMD